MATSPVQLTLKELRKKGIRCEKVEQWNSFAKVRHDLFGILDVAALDLQRGVIGIQCTDVAHQAEHYKILTVEKWEATLDWLETPGTVLELWSWRKLKVKRGGKRVKWEPRIQIITLKDLL